MKNSNTSPSVECAIYTRSATDSPSSLAAQEQRCRAAAAERSWQVGEASANLKISPSKAQIVQAIYRLFAGGASAPAIARLLNKDVTGLRKSASGEPEDNQPTIGHE